MMLLKESVSVLTPIGTLTGADIKKEVQRQREEGYGPCYNADGTNFWGFLIYCKKGEVGIANVNQFGDVIYDEGYAGAYSYRSRE